MYFRLVLTLAAVFVFTACATYQGPLQRARNLLSSGQHELAVQELKPKAAEEGRNQLLHLMDYGVALYQAGEYEKSARIFLMADQMADIKDFLSLSRQAGSLLTSDNLVPYKGEVFEILLINVYATMNYLMMGNLEKAQVECRRLNHKLERLKVYGESLDEQNALARYLSALVWEASGEWNDSYIDYYKAYQIDPLIPDIKKRLLIISKKAGRSREFTKWKKQFPLVHGSIAWEQLSGSGELVYIYQQGWVPRKRAHPGDYRFPTMRAVYSQVNKLNFEVQGKRYDSYIVYNLEKVAIKTLADDYGKLVAKKIAGDVAKHVVADQIGQKNKGLGALAFLAMKIMDQADLRQWATLPQTFQIARMRLPPGSYEVSIMTKNLGVLRTDTKGIKKGHLTFASVRTYK